MKKNSVLFVVEDVNKSGSPQTAFHFVESLSKAYDVDLLIMCSSDKENDLYRLDEFKKVCRKIELLEIPHLITKKYKLFASSYCKVVLKKILTMFEQNEYSYLYINRVPIAGYVFPVIKKRYQCKLVFNALGNLSNYRKSKYFFINNRYKKDVKRLVDNVDFYIAISKNAILKEMSSKQDKITIINDYPVMEYKSSKKIFNKKGKIALGQIGYFADIKNQLFSLRVLNSLIKEDVDASIVFMGFNAVGSDAYYKKMESYILENELGKHVKFIDKDSDKNQFFDSIDLTLLPSITEGLPIVALESQTRRTPCLASLVVPEEANHGLLYRMSIEKEEDWIKFILSENYKKDISAHFDLKNEFDNLVKKVFNIEHS